MDSNIPHNSNSKSYHDLLVELITLKQKDYDQFMERLYETLSGEYKDVINSADPVDEKRKALSTMIAFFQAKEEYEKCAQLKKMIDSLT
ncbi:MAG TPA: hypothetical protein HA367_06505 [Candidatus Methanofastidiosum sp.]|jgi:hypothetical protein|nr:hypothetical protein [Methanofastidiosum sp.]